MDIEEIRTRARGVDTTAICDADKETRVVSAAIRGRSRNSWMCGSAYTVRCRDDFFGVIRAIESASPTDVIVVDGGGRELALAGELFARAAQQRGLSGIIVDGGYRDMAYVSGCELPIFSRYVTPMAGSTAKLGELQVPVNCGGVVVRPGDIIVSDTEGIVVLDPADITSVLTAAEQIKVREAAAIEQLCAGRGLSDCLNVAEHAGMLARKAASTLTFTV